MNVACDLCVSYICGADYSVWTFAPLNAWKAVDITVAVTAGLLHLLHCFSVIWAQLLFSMTT